MLLEVRTPLKRWIFLREPSSTFRSYLADGLKCIARVAFDAVPVVVVVVVVSSQIRVTRTRA